jgi:hypothetical protein
MGAQSSVCSSLDSRFLTSPYSFIPPILFLLLLLLSFGLLSLLFSVYFSFCILLSSLIPQSNSFYTYIYIYIHTYIHSYIYIYIYIYIILYARLRMLCFLFLPSYSMLSILSVCLPADCLSVCLSGCLPFSLSLSLSPSPLFPRHPLSSCLSLPLSPFPLSCLLPFSVLISFCTLVL